VLPELGLEHGGPGRLTRYRDEIVFFQVGRWIDQLICGDAGRVAEEKVHYAQAEFCVRSRKYSRWRNCEIRQQPNRTGRGRSSDLVDDRFHLIAWKAIEEEMRHDEIVRM